MNDAIRVIVHAPDPISLVGIVGGLSSQPNIQALGSTAEKADAGVVVGDSVDEDTLRQVRRLRRELGCEVVLVVTRLDDAGLLSATEAGARGILRRREATPEALAAAVRAVVAGEGALPPDVLARLLTQVGQLQRQVLEPRGLTMAGLTQRETSVLHLIAEGLDTAEIARRLIYSERTVKSVIHDITTRLQLRNRSHAVAYALREGLIQ